MRRVWPVVALLCLPLASPGSRAAAARDGPTVTASVVTGTASLTLSEGAESCLGELDRVLARKSGPVPALVDAPDLRLVVTREGKQQSYYLKSGTILVDEKTGETRPFWYGITLLEEMRGVDFKTKKTPRNADLGETGPRVEVIWKDLLGRDGRPRDLHGETLRWFRDELAVVLAEKPEKYDLHLTPTLDIVIHDPAKPRRFHLVARMCLVDADTNDSWPWYGGGRPCPRDEHRRLISRRSRWARRARRSRAPGARASSSSCGTMSGRCPPPAPPW
jgi:hypothetical protein